MCISPHILLLNHDNYLGVFFLTGEIMVKITKTFPGTGNSLRLPIFFIRLDSHDEPSRGAERQSRQCQRCQAQAAPADKNVGPRLEFSEFPIWSLQNGTFQAFQGGVCIGRCMGVLHRSEFFLNSQRNQSQP